MPGAMSCHRPTFSIVPPAFSGQGRFVGSITAVIEVSCSVIHPLPAGVGTHQANDRTAGADMRTPRRGMEAPVRVMETPGPAMVSAAQRVVTLGGVDPVRPGAVASAQGRVDTRPALVDTRPAFTASSGDVIATEVRDVESGCSTIGVGACFVRHRRSLADRSARMLRSACTHALFANRVSSTSMVLARLPSSARSQLRTTSTAQSLVSASYVSGRRSRKNCQTFRTSRIWSRSSSAVISSVLSREACATNRPRGSQK